MERVIAVLGPLITGLRIYCVSQKSQPVTSFHPSFPMSQSFGEDLDCDEAKLYAEWALVLRLSLTYNHQAEAKTQVVVWMDEALGLIPRTV